MYIYIYVYLSIYIYIHIYREGERYALYTQALPGSKAKLAWREKMMGAKNFDRVVGNKFQVEEEANEEAI